MVNKQQRHSQIGSIKLAVGPLLATSEEVHEGVVNYFHQFLLEHCHRDCSNLSEIISKVITKEENDQFMALP